jgi:NADPH:quinone reductase|tara:strand:+ start:888 stop:1889 length:1002 start_codon:yes stop_codon:yes gene_type:complete
VKALIVNAFTDFDQAVVGNLPDPTPGPGEVVVDIRASETNFPDILYIEGKYQKKPPFPFSLGLAGAGLIAEVAEGVDPSLIGARVLTLPAYGTHAERVLAPADWCFPIPDDMDFATAAAFGLVYQTAYFALTARGQIARGDRVLVLGATGGIGMAAIQLAKALGAGTVIAATRGATSGALARDMGADVVVDAAMENLRDGLRDAVMDATDGHGADVVIDPVGGDLTGAALRAMAWSGRLVVVGFAAGSIPKIAANYLLVKNISVSGIQWTDYRARQIERVRDAQAHMFDLWRDGALAPKITATYPLADFAVALRALATGTASGKIILTMGEQT